MICSSFVKKETKLKRNDPVSDLIRAPSPLLFDYSIVSTITYYTLQSLFFLDAEFAQDVVELFRKFTGDALVDITDWELVNNGDK